MNRLNQESQPLQRREYVKRKKKTAKVIVPVINGKSPRLQIFRGLPNSTMEKEAATYPLVHLKQPYVLCRAGAIERFNSIQAYNLKFLHVLKGVMRGGVDIIVSGTMIAPENLLAKMVFLAQRKGYEVWICDFLDEDEDSDIEPDWNEIEQIRRAFVSYTDSTFTTDYKRDHFGDGDMKHSLGSYEEFKKFCAEHVHCGKMPNDYALQQSLLTHRC